MAMTRFSFLLRLPIILLLADIYVALRLTIAAPPGITRWLAPTALLLIYLLILAGFFTRRAVGKPAIDAIAWAGFLSLGLFSWLFVLTLLRDALLIAIKAATMADGGIFSDSAISLLHAASALAVLVVSLLAVLLGLVSARRLARVVDIEVRLPDLAPALRGFTIVQVSDLHVGPTIKRRYVSAVVHAVNELSPDIIALTGDLVDGSVASLSEHIQPLAGLKARHGVYAVTGNHEYYSGAAQWVAEFRRLGFQVLMNQHRVLVRQDATLVVAGVTDFSARNFDAEQASDPLLALHGAPANAAARILLAHQPRSARAAEAAGYDLQLSGHTHGGQFWPWKYFVPLQQPFVDGLHRYGRMQVYVSRGTGYWGPPMRLGARSEITRIRLAG
ncbi:metallophosphoesterase [Paralcaligenes sp. KSB-10]|uniref:metallophosphoesterase n=1 Tax=Paralcaligenes sp. KSB-10 TaxID=2901142 RepID=UPI001E506D4C|nr:metallophosphoesterase [Paralcaligenes sp. KSB-10]UHL66199.1 metallophosphoesterase [Paralcaligenes sp. KSB-10]